MSHLEQAVELKAQLDALRPLNPEQEKRIWQKFRFDWNYHSNNIEGNSLTFGETKSLLLHNITAQGKPLKDHIEITGHNEAIDALVDLTRGDAPLTESFVRQLHALILRERYQVDAITSDGAPTRRWIEVGQYKTGQNHVQTVTGEIFRFAEPIDVPEKMHKLLQTINDLQCPSSAEVVLVAANAHYDFVLIHPFDDGNGRMARLLMNLILIKYGFPPAIIKTEDKANYFSALRQRDGGQLEVFVEYIAGRVCASLEIMLAGARGESIEEPDEQDRKIKMLTRLLGESRGEIAASRSLETLGRLFERSFEPLIERLNEKAHRLSPLYLTLQRNVDVGGVFGFGNSMRFEMILTRAYSLIQPDTSNFCYHAEFLNLACANAANVTHTWKVDLATNVSSYTVSWLGEFGTHLVSDSFTRSYDRQMTSDEINRIATALVDEQILAIETSAGVKVAPI